MTKHASKWPPLEQLCPAGVDLGGEYLLELDEACPVHAVVVAGVDIPKYVCRVPHVCPGCGHRASLGPGESPACPACAKPDGTTVNLQPVRGAAPARMRKRMFLSDAQVRAIWAKLHPSREVKRDDRGRRLDGPRRVPDKAGGEMLAFPFVRLTRVDEADPAALAAETPETARQRMQRVARLAQIAEALGAPNVRAGRRDTLLAELKKLRRELGLDGADAADETEAA